MPNPTTNNRLEIDLSKARVDGATIRWDEAKEAPHIDATLANGLHLTFTTEDPALISAILRDTKGSPRDSQPIIDVDVIERLLREGRLIPKVDEVE